MVKARSRLQTRITASFILLVLVISGLTFVYTSGETKKALKEILRDELSALASTIATQIDGDSLASLTVGAESTATFIRIRDQLLAIQRAHPDIRYVYTFTRAVSDSTKIEFLVDAEYGRTDSLAPPPSIGDVYDETTAPMLAALVAPAVETDFASDRWGTFLSGYAPIRNRAGVVVGAVGIDMLSTRVLEKQAFIGTTIYVIAIAVLLAGTIIVIFSMAITERKWAEEALRESEDRYRQLVENAGEAIFVAQDGRLMFVNRMTAELSGRSERELLSGPFIEFVHPDDRGFVMERHLRRLGGDAFPSRYAFRLMAPDGRIPWVEVAAVLIDWGGKPATLNFLTDITERRRAEEALAQEQFLLQALMNNVPDHVYFKDRDSRLIRISKAQAQAFGVSDPAQAVGKTDFDFFTEEHARQAYEDEQAVMRTGQPVSKEERETWAGRPDTWVSTTKVPLRDAAGNVVGTFGISRDITERKRAEEEKAELEARNRQLQKAESLSRMAGAIAHHFNNQLQAVLLNLEMAKDDLLHDAGPADRVIEAMMAANRAAEMSMLMLTYLGQTYGVRESLDLSDACGRWLSLLGVAVPKHVVLKTDLASPGPAIRANADQMRQVLTHLVTNAWEAGGAGRGEIQVAVTAVTSAAVPTEHRVPPDWQPLDSAYACLEVVDHGCGIAEADIERIFDPFFSSKFTGRGLGLSVVLGIVRAHGGAVTVESAPGLGSAFRVYLPVSEAGATRSRDS
jgi:PAS domain S-box-containing protein